jgi:hypothetical protein
MSPIVSTIRIGTIADLPGIRLIHPSVAEEQCVVAADGEDVLDFAILNYTFFNQGFVPLVVVAIAKRRIGIGTQLLRGVERRCATAKIFVSSNRSKFASSMVVRKVRVCSERTH